MAQFLDQQAVWQQAETDYRTGDPFLGPKQHAGLTAVPGVYHCPADDRVRQPHTVRTRIGTEISIAVGSYLGNPGITSRTRDGLLYTGSAVSFLSITYGTSNTLLAGERPPAADLQYGWWYTGAGQDGTGSLDSVLGPGEQNRSPLSGYPRCGRGPFPFAAGRLDDRCAAFHFWSLHPGGANFAFCDGSVRFPTYSADAILPALATRGGGEVAALD